MSTRFIWKYEAGKVHAVPKGASYLHADFQNGVPAVWALVNPEAEAVDVEFSIHGTGQPISWGSGYGYIGSALDGVYVWHFLARELP